MILDKKLVLADGQAVTASAATTDHIDLGGIERVTGQPLHMIFSNVADTAVTTCTSITFSVQDATVTGFNGSGEPRTIASTGAIAVADLVSGYQIALPIPEHCRQFVRGYFTVAGSNAATNSFEVQIVEGIHRNIAMPDGVAASA